MQGRVTDVLGDPIPAAIVVVRRAADEVVIGRAPCDGEGMWRIARLPGDGTFVVEASASGKVDARIGSLHAVDGDTPTCNLELADGVPLRGVVRCAGQPLAGALVIVRAPGLRTTVRTDAAGRYEFAAVPLRGTAVACCHGGRSCAPVAVDGRGRPDIVEDLELDGARSQPRLLIAVDVPAAVRAGSWFEVCPDDHLVVPDLVHVPLRADGACQLDALPFAHEVVLHVPGHVATPPFARCAAGDAEDLEFRVEAAPVVAATVAHGVVTRRGQGPVAGARVVLRDRDGVWLAEASTGADGAFAAPVLRPRGAWLAVRALLPAADLVAETTATLGVDAIALEMADTTSIAGSLVDARGRALAFSDVHVVVHGARGTNEVKLQAFTTTDRAGHFVARGLPVGPCEIAACDPAGNLGTATVALAAATSATAPALAYEPGAALAGRVVDAAGRPLPGVRVHVASTHSGRPPNWQFAGGSGQTDRDGRYRIRGLRPGDFCVVVRDVDGSTLAESTGTAAAGAVGTVDIKLPQ